MVCGPVRSAPGTPVLDIVVVGGHDVAIFNIANATWTQGKASMNATTGKLNDRHLFAANNLEQSFSDRTAVPYGSTFLLVEQIHPVVYKYIPSSDTWDEMPMAVRPSTYYYGSATLVDLDTFPSC